MMHAERIGARSRSRRATSFLLTTTLTVPAIIALVALVMGCGRPDIEEAQRSWLQEQHRVEKQLIELRGRHDDLLRQLAPTRADDLADSASVALFARVTAVLREHDARLNAIDTMIDRRGLARDVAIRADDKAAVAAAYAAAQTDYDAALLELDVIGREHDELANTSAAIRFRDVRDTTGTSATSDGASSPADTASTTDTRSPKTNEPIDNTIGRDEPDEPGE